jgi:hypothetical protein
MCVRLLCRFGAAGAGVSDGCVVVYVVGSCVWYGRCPCSVVVYEY